MESFLCLFLLLVGTVLANVEKVIFTAPPPSPLQSQEPNFDDLEIERLSPHEPSTRTYITAAFASKEAPDGAESWFYLDGLRPGQRYEQPTTFTLTTHTLSDILDSPPLISSLTTFSTTHLPTLLHNLQSQDPHSSHPLQLPPKLGLSSSSSSSSPQTSALFLQIHAAADYFSLEKGLMQNVPPVQADIILDPFLFNVFPKSLVPTAGYLVIVAVGAWLVAWLVWVGVEGVAERGGWRKGESGRRGGGGGGKKDI
ncbi:hypothetical protein FQN51_005905 [Onygenales sp. PD_10]|nr:hypothetical protein FQN51_005905 [Onygenales sp. PD_10]